MRRHRDPDVRRRRKEDLVRPLEGLLLAGLIVIAVLTYALLTVASDAKEAATDAEEAATIAHDNTVRLNDVEKGLCRQLQNVRAATNRNGAIIYIVLEAVTSNVEEDPDNDNESEYRQLAFLPRFNPPVNCVAAIDDPRGYKQPQPRPFGVLSEKELNQILGLPPTTRTKRR